MRKDHGLKPINKGWTAPELAKIKLLTMEGLTIYEIAKKTGRTKDDILFAVNEWGIGRNVLKAKGRIWTRHELFIIRMMLKNNADLKVIARLLKRTEACVQDKVNSMQKRKKVLSDTCLGQDISANKGQTEDLPNKSKKVN